MKKLLLPVILAATALACSKPADDKVTVTSDAAPADDTPTVEAAKSSVAATVVASDDGGIAPERQGIIEVLPEAWPDSWIVVNDASFFHMSDGKFTVLDVDAETQPQQYKGMFNGSKIAQLVQSSSRPEFYVAETFLSRGQRGERTDVLTIIDKRSLQPVDEVILPPKRIHQLPTQFAMQLTDNERKALVFNLTPATSVSVVDLDKREFLGEIPIPGCAAIYGSGGNGFSSLCADGTLLSVALDAAGGTSGTPVRSEKFFDTDEDALFERPAMMGHQAYFPTFLGNVVPVDFSADAPVIGERWSLLGADDSGWRPSGIQLAGSDDAERLYVLMHPEGKEGTHKDPGVEVWVYDVAKKLRIDRISLKMPAITIEVTGGDAPRLLATNVEMSIDVYDAENGRYLRTLTDFGQETPLLLIRSK